MLKLSSRVDPNFDVRSVCDLWSVNRDKAADAVQAMFGARPRAFKDTEEMLADQDLDAVIIATGDHQHARIWRGREGRKGLLLREADGQHARGCEARRDTVKASGRVVQMGSQWLSDPYQIEGARAHSRRQGWQGRLDQPELELQRPPLARAQGREIATIREQDTDWNRWLLGRPSRPFDPRAYFEFRIFKDFSGGITDQSVQPRSRPRALLSGHFIPDDTVALGGIFAWHDVRENPDTFQCISSFTEKEVLYTYGTTFGNGYGDHTIIRGTRGTLYSPGGEGSPQWWFLPETKSEWRYEPGVRPEERRGQAAARDRRRAHGTAAGSQERRPARPHRQLARVHRSRKAPNGNIDTGFAHAVAVVMATRSYREGKKMRWDRRGINHCGLRRRRLCG